MADTVEFELVAPERLLMSTPVSMVVVPGAEGDFGVLPGHAPFISPVRTGVIDVYRDGAVERRIFVSGGFAEVTPERCTVLADEADSTSDAAGARAATVASLSPRPVSSTRSNTPRRTRFGPGSAYTWLVVVST